MEKAAIKISFDRSGVGMKTYAMLIMAAGAWLIVFVWAVSHGTTPQSFVDFVKEAVSRCET